MSCPVPDRVKAARLYDNCVTRKHITYKCMYVLNKMNILKINIINFRIDRGRNQKFA